MIKDMTKGPVVGHLLAMAGPMAIGMFVQTLLCPDRPLFRLKAGLRCCCGRKHWCYGILYRAWPDAIDHRGDLIIDGARDRGGR